MNTLEIKVDREVALAAFRAYHGKAANQSRGLYGWQLALWERVAIAAIEAWRDANSIPRVTQ